MHTYPYGIDDEDIVDINLQNLKKFSKKLTKKVDAAIVKSNYICSFVKPKNHSVAKNKKITIMKN